MEEQPKADPSEVEDLDVPSEDGEEVKGGNFSKIDPWVTGRADKPDAARGGWDGNHNETLVRA